MSLLSVADTLPLLACPRCRSPLRVTQGGILCSAPGCLLGYVPFAMAGNQPVLVDPERSVLVESATGAVLSEPGLESLVRSWARRVTTPRNAAAARGASRLRDGMPRTRGRPRLLIVGGATIGNGAELLYVDPSIDVMAFDLRPTVHTQFVADAHDIPIADRSVDAVWIQAVLEHVLEPARVVSEIHRVLGDGGLVYAETPFLQAVHEGAHDFTRFTESGHRWLFRDFEAIDRGVVAGPGIALAWAVDRMVRGLFRSEIAGRAAWIAVSWLRWLDGWIPAEHAVDAASCVYFLGRKSDRAIGPAEIVREYRGAQCAR